MGKLKKRGKKRGGREEVCVSVNRNPSGIPYLDGCGCGEGCVSLHGRGQLSYLTGTQVLSNPRKGRGN